MGQKVNPNIFRLGINKLWKSDSAITKHKNSSLNNLFIYLTLKNELSKKQLILSDFKIRNVSKTFEILIQALVYFKIKTVRKKYKWWRRFRKKDILKNNFKLKFFIFILKKTKKKKNYILKKKFKINNFWNFFLVYKKNKKQKFKINSFYRKKYYWKKRKNKIKLIKIKNLLKINKLAYRIEKKINFMYNKSVKVQIINVLNTLPKRNKKINNRIFKQLFRFKRNPALKDFISIISVCLHTRQIGLLSEFISSELQKTNRLGQILKIISNILKKQKKYFSFRGFKISMWGKLNKAGRSKKRIISLGDLSFQTLQYNINQSLVHCNTRYGVVGIRLSIIF